MSTEDMLRSGALAGRAGVNVETIRYYERRGLLPRPRRSPGGHRLYEPETVTTLRVIKAAQRLGFTLDEVHALLQAGRHAHGRDRDRLHARAAAKLTEVDAKIADLQVIRTTLVDALAAGCDDLMTCATTDGCPLPFADLAGRPATIS